MVDGLFLGHTFACDSPPIQAAAPSTVEVAVASCGRLILGILWRWPTFYTWLKAQREKGLLSDPELHWPEDNLLRSKKGIPSLNTDDQNTDLSHLKGGPRTKAVSNNGSTYTFQIWHGFEFRVRVTQHRLLLDWWLPDVPEKQLHNQNIL